MKYWLVKQEPVAYPFSRLVADGQTDWTGIRNYQARNFLREMCVGDEVLYYHSVEEKAVVGIASVSREAFADPTAANGKVGEESTWLAVELRAIRAFVKPVLLSTIKTNVALQGLLLIRHSRLSVMPVSMLEFRRIVELGSESHS